MFFSLGYFLVYLCALFLLQKVFALSLVLDSLQLRECGLFDLVFLCIYLQSQCPAAKAICWNDSYSNFCWGFGSIWTHCWYHPLFPSWSIPSRIECKVLGLLLVGETWFCLQFVPLAFCSLKHWSSCYFELIHEFSSGSMLFVWLEDRFNLK